MTAAATYAQTADLAIAGKSSRLRYSFTRCSGYLAGPYMIYDSRLFPLDLLLGTQPGFIPKESPDAYQTLDER